MRNPRLNYALIAIAVLLAVASSSQVFANQETEPQATIEALQTQVAEQATTIAELSSTPTPVPTVSVVPEASNERIDIGGDIAIASYLLAQEENDLYLFVDLVNESAAPLISPYLTVKFFDSDDNLLGSEQLYADVHWSPPGGHVPYNGESVLDGAYDAIEIADMQFSWQPQDYYSVADVDVSYLEITGVPVEGEEQDVSGRIQNNGSVPVSTIDIYYVTYDSAGIIVGLCWDRLDVTIPAGKSAKFSMSNSCLNVSYGKEASKAGSPFTYRLFLSRSGE